MSVARVLAGEIERDEKVRPRNITLICPTRGRPQRFRAMLESALATAAHPERIEVLLLLDFDDAEAPAYFDAPLPPCVRVVHGTERKSVPAMQDEAALHLATGDLLMSCPDDILFRTQHWDALVNERYDAVGDELLVGWTNDGNDRDKCMHFFVSRRWMEIVGHFMWPEFEHFSGDEWVERVAKAAGRGVYLREVVTEHMHAKYKKAPNDDTYRRTRVTAADGTSMSERDNRRMQALLGQVKDLGEQLRLAIADHQKARAA